MLVRCHLERDLFDLAALYEKHAAAFEADQLVDAAAKATEARELASALSSGVSDDRLDLEPLGTRDLRGRAYAVVFLERLALVPNRCYSTTVRVSSTRFVQRLWLLIACLWFVVALEPHASGVDARTHATAVALVARHTRAATTCQQARHRHCALAAQGDVQSVAATRPRPIRPRPLRDAPNPDGRRLYLVNCLLLC